MINVNVDSVNDVESFHRDEIEEIKMLFTKEWYEVMELFERNCNGRFRFDREEKEMWKIGAYYQQGECNEWFKMFLAGYMAGRAAYIN